VRDAADRHGRRALPAVSSLLGVLAQRLVRKLCPACKRQDDDGHWHPVGCPSCSHTGYKGRTGVYELMVVDDACAR
jgi:general secretion pathway protein E